MSAVKGMEQTGLIDPRAVVKVPMWARARGYSDEVVKFWAGMMRDKRVPDAVRLRASENLADRAWGKAPMIVLGDDDRPAKINIALLGAEDAARLEEALMALIGDSIANAPGRNASLVDGTQVSPDSETPASEADKGSTEREHENKEVIRGDSSPAE